MFKQICWVDDVVRGLKIRHGGHSVTAGRSTLNSLSSVVRLRSSTHMSAGASDSLPHRFRLLSRSPLAYHLAPTPLSNHYINFLPIFFLAELFDLRSLCRLLPLKFVFLV